MIYTPVCLVLGTPLCNNNPNAALYAPSGQQEFYRTMLRRDATPKQIMHDVFLEWVAIVQALRVMGIDFVVAMPPQHIIEEMVPGGMEALQQDGYTTVVLPCDDLSLIMFPRDVAVCLPNGKILLNDTISKTSPLWADKTRIVSSPFGEGGRIHIAGNVAIVPRHLIADGGKEWMKHVEPRHLEVLHAAELKTRLVHNTLYYQEEENLRGYIMDDHIDRVSGLLRDSAGRLHLVVDPQIQAGGTSVFQPPVITPQQTIESWRRICDELGIEMHVPAKPFSVPMACGFMQFRDGRVLATGGDEQLAEILTGILGTDRVFFTSIPFQYFPVQSKAGIHCLLNYLPKAFFIPQS